MANLPSRASSGSSKGSIQGIACVVFDDVSGDDDQVGLPVPAGVDHVLEERAAEARGQVEVGELDDRQSVERLGEGGEGELPLALWSRNDSLPGSRSSQDLRPLPIRASRPERASGRSARSARAMPSGLPPQGQEQRVERPERSRPRPCRATA